MVRLGWLEAPYWVLLGLGRGARVLAGVGMARRGEAQAGLSAGGVAGRLEELGAWRRGTLTALLDQPRPEPARRCSRWPTGPRRMRWHGGARRPPSRSRGRCVPSGWPGPECSALGLAAFVIGRAGARARRRALAPGAGLGGHGSAGADPRSQRGRGPRRFRGPRAGGVRPPSGDALAARAGRRLARRAASGSIRIGRATVTTGRSRATSSPALTSGSRSSDTVMIRVRLPVFLGSLSVTAHYPAYLGLEAEPVPTGGDTLLLPAGTRLETRGEATAPLASAAWTVGAALRGTQRRRRPVRRELRPVRLGRVSARARHRRRRAARLATRCGCRSASSRTARPASTCRCRAPTRWRRSACSCRWSWTCATTMASRASCSRAGASAGSAVSDSAPPRAVALPAGTPDRAILTHTLDLTRRGLLPGDTVRYLAVAVGQHASGARPAARASTSCGCRP